MDRAHKEADEQLTKLSKRIVREYHQAQRGIIRKANDYFNQFENEDKMMFALVDNGSISRDKYIEWRKIQLAQGQKWNDTIKAISKDYSEIQKITAEMTNEHMDEVFANNINYGTYEIERGIGINTSFTLYNTDAVRQLLVDNPELLPKPDITKLIPKAERWNMQKVNSALLQGILQGDSIDKIASRLRRVTSMNMASSVRNARTMTTRAENAGRVRAYERAQDLGIEVMKKWVATLDHRTRDSHVDLDGEVVKMNETFSNGLDYPGGAGEPAEVYNCRCTMVAEVKGYEYNDNRTSKYLEDEGMSYDDWKNKHKN